MLMLRLEPVKFRGGENTGVGFFVYTSLLSVYMIRIAVLFVTLNIAKLPKMGELNNKYK